MKNKTIVIAEAGVNHNGDLNLAKKLITKASQIGADYIKFQTFSADRLVTKFAKRPKYSFSKKKKFQYDMLKKLEINNKDKIKLKKI